MGDGGQRRKRYTVFPMGARLTLGSSMQESSGTGQDKESTYSGAPCFAFHTGCPECLHLSSSILFSSVASFLLSENTPYALLFMCQDHMSTLNESFHVKTFCVQICFHLLFVNLQPISSSMYSVLCRVISSQVGQECEQEFEKS